MTQDIAPRATVRSLVALPEYRRRFDEVLGPEKSAAFLGSLTSLTADKNLADCEPRSVVAAAFVAATLDLPVNKNLGFAWIVPYKGVGSFQLGWKGVVQLALRSGQYRRMNAFRVNAEAYKGLDDMGEAIIDTSALDDTKPAIGYAIAWELVNGFRKLVYWSREKIISHAERYSQAYRSKGKFQTPWQTHFDEMALKTVAVNGLRTWGMLSVQMQRAVVEDQAARADIDAEPVYLDAVTVEETLDGPDCQSRSESLLEKITKE